MPVPCLKPLNDFLVPLRIQSSPSDASFKLRPLHTLYSCPVSLSSSCGPSYIVTHTHSFQIPRKWLLPASGLWGLMLPPCNRCQLCAQLAPLKPISLERTPLTTHVRQPLASLTCSLQHTAHLWLFYAFALYLSTVCLPSGMWADCLVEGWVLSAQPYSWPMQVWSKKVW